MLFFFEISVVWQTYTLIRHLFFITFISVVKLVIVIGIKRI